MIRYQVRRFFVILAGSSLLACAAAAFLWNKKEGASLAGSQVDSLLSGDATPVADEGGMHDRGPRPAPPMLVLNPQFEAAEVVPEVEPRPDKRETERFFLEERRIMAETWKLTEEQTVEFEIAVREAQEEQQEVLARMMSGGLSSVEVAVQLEAVAKRAEKRLREVLGPDRLLEYRHTAGLFVRGGFDKQPFVPPTVEYVGDGETS